MQPENPAGFPADLSIPLGSSRRLGGLLLTAHAVGWGVLPALDLPVWIRGTLAVALAGSLLYALLRDGWRRLPGSVTELRLWADGSCAVKLRQGSWQSCRIRGESFVAPWLTVLSLAQEGRLLRRYVVILPDALDPEAFRRLRVWLRWKPGA